MAIDVKIEDGRGSNGSASVIEKNDIPSGLLVYTESFRDIIGQTKALVSPVYGADFNVNAAFGGTPEVIHNGTDTVVWTGSALTGTWDFASTTQAQAGTKSVEAINTVNNDEAQFEAGVAISNAAYVAVTGYIYITSWATIGTKDIRVRNRLAGVDVGNELDLSAYIDNTLFNSWQKFTIPVEDFAMSAGNIDQLIVKTVDIGGGAAPDYYLDTLQWEETGGATWTVTPDSQSIYRISDINITIADAYDSTLASSSHQKIPYDTLLGVSALTTGLGFKLTTNGVVRFDGSFKQHIDFMSFPGITCQSGGDGTNTWVTYTIHFDPNFILDYRTDDKFEMTLSEDLSGLLYARVFVRGGKEEITKI
jgi:hypothetical protein